MKRLFITFLILISSLMGFSQHLRLVAVSYNFNPDIVCTFSESVKYCGRCSWDGWTHWHYYTQIYPGVTYIATPSIRIYQSRPKQPVRHQPYQYHKPSPSHVGTRNIHPRPTYRSVPESRR